MHRLSETLLHQITKFLHIRDTNAIIRTQSSYYEHRVLIAGNAAQQCQECHKFASVVTVDDIKICELCEYNLTVSCSICKTPYFAQNNHPCVHDPLDPPSETIRKNFVRKYQNILSCIRTPWMDIVRIHDVVLPPTICVYKYGVMCIKDERIEISSAAMHIIIEFLQAATNDWVDAKPLAAIFALKNE